MKRQDSGPQEAYALGETQAQQGERHCVKCYHACPWKGQWEKEETSKSNLVSQGRFCSRSDL